MAKAAMKGKQFTVTATELFERTGEVISRVQFGGERIVVIRHGKPAAVIAPLSASDLARLQESAA